MPPRHRIRPAMWLLTLAAAAFALTCVEVPDNAVFACEEGGCPSPLVCKAGFCVNEECEALTCAGLGKNCGTISDGCGNELDCGTCTSPESCNANVCTCQASSVSVSAICADAGRACGTVSVTDACGVDRQVDCGGCANGGTCGANGTCCTPKPVSQACAERSATCGDITVKDSCGERVVSCGGCDAGSVCNVQDTSAACEPCVPETDGEFCYRNGFECGAAPTLRDNCGTPRSVATCPVMACDDGRMCGQDGGTRCACAIPLQSCSNSAQCCGGLSCGSAGLCCVPPGAQCGDDGECCGGTCTAGLCTPRPDGGSS